MPRKGGIRGSSRQAVVGVEPVGHLHRPRSYRGVRELARGQDSGRPHGEGGRRGLVRKRSAEQGQQNGHVRGPERALGEVGDFCGAGAEGVHRHGVEGQNGALVGAARAHRSEQLEKQVLRRSEKYVHTASSETLALTPKPKRTYASSRVHHSFNCCCHVFVYVSF